VELGTPGPLVVPPVAIQEVDELGRSLLAAHELIERNRAERDELRRRIVSTLLDELGQMLHRIAWELRPASLDELGLTTALENYVVEWGHKHAIQADFHCSDPRLDKRSNEIRTTVYRVIQEGLTNVAKHAGNATNASVIIGVAENTLHLAIEDNGQGFDPSTSSTRLGLAGMRERLLLVGGRLAIESSPETGTTIFARIPIRPERAA